MQPSECPSASNNPTPLILPKANSAPPEDSSTFNVFRLILEEGRRKKTTQPVIDLEADVSVINSTPSTQSPAPKKRREQMEEGEISDDSSDNMSVLCIDEHVQTLQSETNIVRPQIEGVIDLTAENETARMESRTLREVLSSLCRKEDIEDGEIVEGEESVLAYTPGSLNMTLRSQVESNIVDLTVDEDPSDSDNEVICVDDLTIIDDEEFASVGGNAIKRRQSKKRGSPRTSLEAMVCVDIQRQPSVDDALSKATIERSGIPTRYWETFRVAPSTSCSSAELRVCSYNVLCQLTTLKTMYLYEHLSEDYRPLQWEHRWPLLEQELLRLNADIYGLQEVQYDHYDSHFRSMLSEVGYAGYYKKRTGMMDDGCAVFVRRSRFDVINYRIVEYFVGTNTSMDRDQIGQIIRLKCKKTGQDLIYANTHLLFNSARGDIKLGQLAMLFANIKDVMAKSPCPVIVNGDFNIEPLSYVYTYVSESSVFLRGLPRNELSGQGRLGGPRVRAENILPPAANVARDSMFIQIKAPRKPVAADYFTHPLRLASVYHHFSESGQKEVSTYHKDVANPDYIFYSIENKTTSNSTTTVYEAPELRLYRRLGLPCLDILKNTLGPWPNFYVPSDHIPLVADFVLTKQGSRR